MQNSKTNKRPTISKIINNKKTKGQKAKNTKKTCHRRSKKEETDPIYTDPTKTTTHTKKNDQRTKGI
jgi:hypothetical protein